MILVGVLLDFKLCIYSNKICFFSESNICTDNSNLKLNIEMLIKTTHRACENNNFVKEK